MKLLWHHLQCNKNTGTMKDMKRWCCWFLVFWLFEKDKLCFNKGWRQQDKRVLEILHQTTDKTTSSENSFQLISVHSIYLPPHATSCLRFKVHSCAMFWSLLPDHTVLPADCVTSKFPCNCGCSNSPLFSASLGLLIQVKVIVCFNFAFSSTRPNF